MDFGKIFGSVDADDIADVVRLVVENRELISRLGQLPELFEQFSQSLTGAGAVLGAVGAAMDKVGDHLGDTSSQAHGFLAAP